VIDSDTGYNVLPGIRKTNGYQYTPFFIISSYKIDWSDTWHKNFIYVKQIPVVTYVNNQDVNLTFYITMNPTVSSIRLTVALLSVTTIPVQEDGNDYPNVNYWNKAMFPVW
jgi:hypothetical protein